MDLGAASRELFVNGTDELASFPSDLPAPSVALLLEALAGAGVGTWHFDAETGLTSWDAVASRILGYEPIPHVSGGMGPVHPDDHILLRETLERGLRENKPYDVQFRGVRVDGEVRWLHAVAGPPTASESGALRVTGIVADVTGRKAVDYKLRLAEERHDIVSRAATDLVFEWDLVTDTLRWNDSAVDWLQYRPEDLTSATGMQEWLHPDEQEVLSEKFHEAVQNGCTKYRTEHRLKKGDGTFADVINTLHIIRNDSAVPVQIISTMHDVTELKRADAALRESEAVNRSIVEASADIIQLLDVEGKLEFMNSSGVRALEIEDPDALVGKDWVALWPRSARPAARQAVDAARIGAVGRFTELCPTAAGEPKWWDVVVSPVLGSDGQTTKLVTISRDITERKQAAERVAWSANHDPLTGLANRAAFQAALDEMMLTVQEGHSFGLLLFDLDDFKQVNDTLGHDAGDAVLTTFASRLNEVLGTVATLARLGGDEFAAIVPNVTDENALTGRAESILRRMREPFVNESRILDCHVTIGGALFPQHGQDAGELFKSADIALYAAKSARRGASMIFEPRHRAQVQERLSMISLARTGVKEDRIVPFYQPKVLLEGGGIRGFEALLRWYHPHHGLQLPATIAAAFDDLDLAKAISEKMIDQVIADMRDWLDRGIPFEHVAVNAGAAEFRHDDFGERVLERLENSGIPTKCFQLEVTETVFLGRGAECVERALKLLAAAGVKIALDDFGTGYASLRHLKQFPVDVIKIDQSFVRDMGGDTDDTAIIEAVLHLGRSLKIDVVAEGIESRAQEARLRELGCRYGQGFLYAAAMPSALVPTSLSNQVVANKQNNHISGH
jgi:diguanylate cyclase (GGDEF)-like protein/PAS domain S-box-containing protein